MIKKGGCNSRKLNVAQRKRREFLKITAETLVNRNSPLIKIIILIIVIIISLLRVDLLSGNFLLNAQIFHVPLNECHLLLFERDWVYGQEKNGTVQDRPLLYVPKHLENGNKTIYCY